MQRGIQLKRETPARGFVSRILFCRRAPANQACIMQKLPLSPVLLQERADESAQSEIKRNSKSRTSPLLLIRPTYSVYIRLLLCCFARRRRRHLPQLPDVWFSLSLPLLLFHLRCPTFFLGRPFLLQGHIGRAGLPSTICSALFAQRCSLITCGETGALAALVDLVGDPFPLPPDALWWRERGSFWRRHEPNWTGRRKRKRENKRRGR